jgi:protoporphyrinogen oxidase
MGGGPAGLAAGYYASRHGIPFTVFESADAVGGNCRTIRYNDFFFDTGAHRFHDKDPRVTAEVTSLLGNDLRKIYAPSRIYSEGVFIDFPLTPFDLFKKTGVAEFTASVADVVRSRISSRSAPRDFERYALQAYGKRIAERFLLGYSEKLWGLPAASLSVSIAGKRLKGLDLRTFMLEAFAGAKAKTRHIDGEFYYPEKGIGQIFDKVADTCGHENIRLRSRITGVLHKDEKITGIEINGEQKHDVRQLVNTLPITLLAGIMKPALPAHILEPLSSLRFRNVILVCLLIDKHSVSNDATIYFPGRNFMFTRVYEPRNRSARMSPPAQTSLVAEIPCFSSDEYWNAGDDEIAGKVKQQVISTGLVKEVEVKGHFIYRITNAYPVLEKDVHEKLAPVQRYLGRFNNLHQSGRSGMFAYTHIHDMFARASEIVREVME